MKKLTINERKKIMLELLKYTDDICREHNIKYSLFAGSLIGTIRHHGYIPWDDDIDIILTKENYEKLKTILDKKTGRYQTLKFGRGGERFSFLKLIDTKTHLIEGAQTTFDPYYGVYIDIFCYYPTSDNEKLRKKHYQKIKLLESLTSRGKLNFKNESLAQNTLRLGKNIISKIIGYKRLNQLFQKTMNKYHDKTYIVSNWPAYGYQKEIQLAKNTKEYTDAKFENLTVMIFKNYDEILRTTFGDYMQLPPLEARKSRHTLKMWWREK